MTELIDPRYPGMCLINPKVVGSNPTPATNQINELYAPPNAEFLAPVPKMCPKTRRSFEADAKELQAAKAEAEGMKAARVPKFVAFLAKYGYVDLA